MAEEMTLDQKLDYLLEMVEDVQNRVEQLVEAQEELVEKVADLGTPFAGGMYEFDTQ